MDVGLVGKQWATPPQHARKPWQQLLRSAMAAGHSGVRAARRPIAKWAATGSSSGSSGSSSSKPTDASAGLRRLQCASFREVKKEASSRERGCACVCVWETLQGRRRRAN